MAYVSVLKCSKYDKQVLEIVDEALNLVKADKKFKKGMKVLIKPNILASADPSKGITTHPLIIEGIIKYLKKFDVKIFIGESTGSGSAKGTKKAFETSGIASVARKNQVKLINFDEGKQLVKKNNKSVVMKNVVISESLNEMDLIISACKLKTHMLTGYTGAVKNMFGIMPGRSKINAHALGNTLKKFNNVVLDIYLARIPEICLMDAVIGMEGNGPSSGKLKQTDLIIASDNALALDLVASKIIGFKTEELGFLKLAKKRKMIPKKIVVKGLKNVSVPYKKPMSYQIGFIGGVANKLIGSLQSTFEVDKKNCEKCGYCVRACPEKTICMKKKNNHFPEWDESKCIMCYCCHELCPYDAIILKKPLIMRLVDKFVKRFDD